ncbi:globoside alpha-1,3-N-acetylgalactosaminyltransferase 1-like [Osmerus eperlanus]|uniref:globoside alpha-1,3-N-acetylgalactosaminyltransferase 1-like n=1 Tax=Osmerus eperlanus TaxID=29151 RepID=UPI002E159958
MALFPLCKRLAGSARVLRKQLALYCLLLFLLIYFLKGRRTAVKIDKPPIFRSLGLDLSVEARAVTEETVKEKRQRLHQETWWGAPLVWGDSSISVWRRDEFGQRRVHTGLLTLAVGGYAGFLPRFLSSAELHFLPGATVTYYILTDSPRTLEPLPLLAPRRNLKIVPVAELVGWKHLALRRMALLASAIKDPIRNEVEYVFCADVDQEFVAPVGAEILGELVATLHPELYGMPRHAFPYEREPDSSAFVEDGEGDYYYTSELYGGLCPEVYTMARACSQLILQDQERGVQIAGLEESYLNRYFINRRPTCVLSPEYSWWESALAADVPAKRLVSLGRQCESLEPQKREQHGC